MIWNNATQSEVPQIIADRLAQLLEANNKVTWFVSGGSNIALQTKTIKLLGGNLDQLTILLIDERFGAPGHKDSNWEQLKQAGFVIDGPAYIEPFTSAEVNLNQAVERYEDLMRDALVNRGYTFAQLGMGDDGHVSGILPGSAAASVNDKTYVFGYEYPPFARLTTTFQALKQLDEVALVTYGENKWSQLADLQKSIDKTEQPVQIIKDIASVTIYTDYKPSNS